MSDQLAHLPGDIVNGHRLWEDHTWRPLSTVELLDWRVQQQVRGDLTTAWLFWFIAGGIGAHLAYLYPRNRALILVVSIVLFVVTFGISGICLWVFTWPAMLSGSALAQRKADTRKRIADEMMLNHQLGIDAW